MNISDIKNEPTEKTKDDAFKLSLLASQLKRLPNDELDYEGAMLAWKKSVEFVRAFRYEKPSEGGIQLAGKIISIRLVPLKTALEAMGYTVNVDKKTGKLDSQWKDTIRKKLKNAGLKRSVINNLIKDWEKEGVPVNELNDFKNERVKFTQEDEERIQDLIDNTAETVRVFSAPPLFIEPEEQGG